MLSDVECSTFSNLSTRGVSEFAQKSVKIAGSIKNGHTKTILSATEIIVRPENDCLKPFLNENVYLVPVPRSSRLVDNALWPTKVIADILVEKRLGREVLPILNRVTQVPKSSASRSADERVSCDRHYETILVTPTLDIPEEITIIDDILTLGRTTFACARRLKEHYPDSTIRIFTLMRTMGLVNDIERLIDPRVGVIHFNELTRKTSVNI